MHTAKVQFHCRKMIKIQGEIHSLNASRSRQLRKSSKMFGMHKMLLCTSITLILAVYVQIAIFCYCNLEIKVEHFLWWA